MISAIRFGLKQTRVVLRSIRGLGLRGTIQLARVRLDAKRGIGAGKIYAINVPGLAYPISIRGGDSSDATVLYQMFGVSEYEPATALKPVEFIFDAGANIGLASLYFLRCYPTAKIFALEPDSGNLAMCRMNLDPYREQVTLHQGALWSSCCRLAMVPCPTEWGLAVRAAKPGEDAPIEAFDFPSLMAVAGQTSVDLLKLDIEGSEAEIFNSAAQSWLQGVRNIVIEFHGDECERRFLKAMDGYQYERTRHPMVEFFFNIAPKKQV